MTVTKRGLIGALGLGGMGTLLAGCNTLSLFNNLTPKDGGIVRVAHDVPFGDDPRQKYDVYAPKGAVNLPVLVFFYGGNWNSGSKDDYRWMGYALASMGYVVAIPDYRLVPAVHYPAFLEDNAAAIKHITAHAGDYHGDISRLGTIGHSAGGYESVMMALDPRYLGEPSPLKVCVGISGPYDFYPFDVPASIEAFGKADQPLETQPTTYARKLDTKFLLMQSRADKVVGMQNIAGLEPKLTAAGTGVTVKYYDGLSHQDMAAGFSIPFRHLGPLYADVKTWLAAHL